MSDKKCYVCQKDTLKNYICKPCYFRLLRDKEKLQAENKRYKKALEHIRDYDGCMECGNQVSSENAQQALQGDKSERD